MSNHRINERGFGLAELIVVIAVMGLLAALAVPSMLTYWQSSTLSAGTAEMASILNRGRQLAISQNGNVCIQVSGTAVRFRSVSCAGTIWAGSGTDGAGLITLASGLQISNPLGVSVIFTNAGGANPGGQYTVTDPRTSRTRIVQVTATGRVIVQ
jgi:prepilin-type N-terminal cleavage/methylation domain-containing protein